MANTNGWELVNSNTKTNKKTNNTNVKQNNFSKKSFVENAPRIDPSPPIKQSQTLFDAFKEKEGHASSNTDLEQKKATKYIDDGSKKINSTKKKIQEKNIIKKATLEECIASIDYSEIETIYLKDCETFPDSPSVWLKDIVSILNLRLDKVPEPDPVFEGKPADYPACLLTNRVRKLLMKIINECPEEISELFYDHCLQTMVNDISKGMSTYGYRILIQLVIFAKPEIVMNNIQKNLDLLKSHQNRPLRCLSILWAVGQVGTHNLGNGLKVWLEIMLPVLNKNALSSYAVHYIESLFNNHTDIKTAENVIGFRNFFPILDMIFAHNSTLPYNLQKKLLDIYPKIKAVSFGSDQKENLHNFFPSFLARATPNTSSKLENEVLSSCVDCLVLDPQCFSKWRQMYTKHISQSSFLLQYILNNWKIVRKRVDKKSLRNTIHAFNVTNDEMIAKGHKHDAGFKQCAITCKELLEKLSMMHFPWKILTFLLLLIAAGLFAYDVHISEDISKTQTVQFLNDTGVIACCDQIVNRTQFYGHKVSWWLYENVPYYYGKSLEFMAPYIQLMYEKSHQLFVYVYEQTASLRAELTIKIPLLLEWLQVNIPIYCDKFVDYCKELWNVIVIYSIWMYQTILQISNEVWIWLEENVFVGKFSVENIQSTLSSSLTSVQSHGIQFVHWMSDLWSTSLGSVSAKDETTTHVTGS